MEIFSACLRPNKAGAILVKVVKSYIGHCASSLQATAFCTGYSTHYIDERDAERTLFARSVEYSFLLAENRLRCDAHFHCHSLLALNFKLNIKKD